MKNMFKDFQPVTNRSARTKVIKLLLDDHDDGGFYGTREQSERAFVHVTAECSIWALREVVEAFREGRINGVADPNYMPSATFLLIEARKFDEARRAFEGGRLANVLGRLRAHAANALPTPEEVRLARIARGAHAHAREGSRSTTKGAET